MYSFKTLSSQLLTSVWNALAVEGFKGKRKGQDLIKKTDFGNVSFHLSFIKHDQDFDVTADVGIRFDALEDLLNAEFPYLTKKQKTDTSSLGVELGNLSLGGPKRWNVCSEADTNSVVPQIAQDFKTIGFPYLAIYSNMEKAFEVCCKDDREALLSSPFHDYRALGAVGLAILLHKDEVFVRDLILRKTRVLEDLNDPGLPRFLKIAQKIAGLSGEKEL